MRYILMKGTIDSYGCEYMECEDVYVGEDRLDEALAAFAELPYRIRCSEDDLEYVDEPLYGMKALYMDVEAEGGLTDEAEFLIGCDEYEALSYDSIDDVRGEMDKLVASASRYGAEH